LFGVAPGGKWRQEATHSTVRAPRLASNLYFLLGLTFSWGNRHRSADKTEMPPSLLVLDVGLLPITSLLRAGAAVFFAFPPRCLGRARDAPMAQCRNVT
jgi:hypothetical protein